MKTITLLHRSTFLGFVFTTIFTVAIAFFIYKLLFIINPEITKSFPFWVFLIGFSGIPILGTYLSMLNDNIYISDLVITEDSIRFVYSKKTKQVNVKLIEKKDIKEFNISYTANRDCDFLWHPSFRFYSNVDIVLNNGEHITLNSKHSNEFYNIQIAFVTAIIKNKEEIPNLNLEINGSYLLHIETCKHLYYTGKRLPLHKVLWFSIKELQLWEKIFGCITIALLLMLFFFNILT